MEFGSIFISTTYRSSNINLTISSILGYLLPQYIGYVRFSTNGINVFFCIKARWSCYIAGYWFCKRKYWERKSSITHRCRPTAVWAVMDLCAYMKEVHLKIRTDHEALWHVLTMAEGTGKIVISWFQLLQFESTIIPSSRISLGELTCFCISRSKRRSYLVWTMRSQSSLYFEVISNLREWWRRPSSKALRSPKPFRPFSNGGIHEGRQHRYWDCGNNDFI